jgi:hypothetical protein
MMKHRKAIMAGVLGLMALFYAGDWLWSLVMEPLESLRQRQQTLQRDVESRQEELAKARKASKELAAWAERSLPADPQVARSVYQAWLLELVNRVGLTRPSVDSAQASDRGGYYSIVFSMQAQGSLEKWVRFLHEFYRAGHLHQIRSLAVTPMGKSEQFDVVLSIEALAIPGGDRGDRLTDELADRLAFENLDEYRVIALRNLFAVSGSNVDPAEETYLTAIQHVNGVPEAWFSVRGQTSPERAVVKVRPGDTLTLGPFVATVVQIAEDDAVLESGGERWLVGIGENLSQSIALPPGLW